ncbi:hypothetical protein [Calycomorphotria hydatis]|uniref:Uncharacterized protein n=1 Tax=Calycomorphotria hydatis TaxID=2528027 RepID=A0A517T3J1_9PLAN|nr:hypothetical protein [Calycomorphotria hydatis]QDT62943.1 hypothetical protein V22_01410 [Calycomorphotria hydatis]
MNETKAVAARDIERTERGEAAIWCFRLNVGNGKVDRPGRFPSRLLFCQRNSSRERHRADRVRDRGNLFFSGERGQPQVRSVRSISVAAAVFTSPLMGATLANPNPSRHQTHEVWPRLLIVIMICWAMISPALAQEEVVDRTPLFTPEDTAFIETLSAEASDTTAEQMSQQAEELLAKRRQQHAGASTSPYSLWYDLLRYPQVYRGKPIEFSARVTPAELDIERQPAGWEILTSHPGELPNTEVLLLVPEDVAVPETDSGERMQVLGVFHKLATLSSEAETDTHRSAPVVIVRDLEVIPNAPRSMVELDPQMWNVVQGRKGLLSTERELYYDVLEHVQQANPGELRQSAESYCALRRERDPKYSQLSERDYPFPTFVDVFQHPDAYYGRPVELTGHARRIVRYPAGTNEFGIETLYETWLFTDDSQNNPAVVISTSLPEGVEPGDDLQLPISMVGYFFKIYAYDAKDSRRIAPLFLASTITPLKTPPSDLPTNWLAGGLLVLLAVVIVWVWSVRKSDRHEKRAPLPSELPEFPDESADTAPSPDTPPQHE